MTCRLFHDWGKWECVVMSYHGMTWAGVWVEGEADCQKRFCKRCGKKQIKKV